MTDLWSEDRAREWAEARKRLESGEETEPHDVDFALARIDALEAEKISLATGWTKAFWIGIYHQDRAKALEAALRAIRGRVALGGATLKDDIQRLVDKALAAPPPASPAGAGSARKNGPTVADIGTVAQALSLMRSIILCGEAFSPQAQASYNAAHAVLTKWDPRNASPPAPAIREDVGEEAIAQSVLDVKLALQARHGSLWWDRHTPGLIARAVLALWRGE